MNVLRGCVCALCLVAVLSGPVKAAEPPKAKDGPLGMKFVPLPKGTFYMGVGRDEGFDTADQCICWMSATRYANWFDADCTAAGVCFTDG